MDERLETGDWDEVFKYAEPVVVMGHFVDTASFTREDVSEIFFLEEGENDGPEWIGVFKLKDGRFAAIRAGCDYTGWDCQASGSADVAANYEDLIRYGLTEDERHRLGIVLESVEG